MCPHSLFRAAANRFLFCAAIACVLLISTSISQAQVTNPSLQTIPQVRSQVTQQTQMLNELQDPAAVAAEVENFLLNHAEVLPGAAQVTAVPPRITQQVACDHMEVFLTNPKLRSKMTAGVRCLAPQPWTLHVQAAVSVLGHYYTANRVINVGEVIELDDLVAREGDLLRLASGVIIDPSHVIGYIAQQRITPGTPLRSNQIRNPDAITRGQTVKTEARGNGFVITGEGIALESGAPGTIIQVRSRSGQVISGTVVNNNTVRILM